MILLRLLETFARKMISLSGKAKTHGMREFMGINDRLSTILTQHAGEMAFVQRSLLEKFQRSRTRAHPLWRLILWGLGWVRLLEKFQRSYYFKKYELLYPFYSNSSKVLKDMPSSYWDYSVKAENIFQETRQSGISGHYRLYNEEDFCEAAVKSHLPFFDEIILVCDSTTTDNTPKIAKELAEAHPEKIKYYFYEPPVLAKLRHPLFKILPAYHPYSLVNFYNYSLSKTTKKIITKLDGDQIAITSEFEKITKNLTKNFHPNEYYTFGGINLYSFEHVIYIDPQNYLCGFDDFSFFYLKKEKHYYTKTYYKQKCWEEGSFTMKNRQRKNAGILFFHLKNMRRGILKHSYRGLEDSEHQKRIRQRIDLVQKRCIDWDSFVEKFHSSIMEKTGTDITELPHPKDYLKKFIKNIPSIDFFN